MDFTSLVLFEKKENDNNFLKEIGSYEVNDGAEYIMKMYYDGDKIKAWFNTKNDVEDWEYSACYDLFNEELFTEKGFDISEVDDEYNPTWLVKFDFIEEHTEMQNRIYELCSLIKQEMDRIFKSMQGKKDEYI
ncbi:hypothetical protein BJV85_003054 [Clostridium acetobutylicum]|uniref:Uncharacterized protein n=1 Tax=Clostridium acetobutylicum (strain ATCC 824 / DSM 792 / JCM 1419 / IAM 19013 / LMG 5710 / NBRC 13948 / NRRL B-527 / VKM B-1787 / 2291 / W) TaxID=272562 RepID=Q97KG6_CLOAB|nr:MULTISPECIES: DUF6762 family protein [Clostridium]AAK78929.1 Hypothetical protein CA_C0953 [Clostridium acetobutylicum ATCC 824]ADZ20004.1 Conserved hypothetical protein [Clostridium acetobutylicum EA 2018]AEI31517.1 hypothetical protein SMB_G0970 [Clostridium acetobutylicum DSM 1731]AWV80648.1 hypothetical protein DK921_11165 [Clostridium acetobutylicum]KHD35966.1 hypothetical protein NL50_11880 [Clostridium acetobutylicum]